ncbi:unnamed protein product [Sphagnum balticum]
MKENDKNLEALMVYVNALSSPHLKDYTEQLEEIFDKAVLAALFTVSNEKRVGLLATLYENPIFGRSKCRSILDKLMKGGLIFVEDIQSILPKLRDWQKREDNSFVSPLEYAVFEHNLMSLTAIYDTVSVKTLLSLLHMQQVKVYMLLERMIRNNKIQAEIDTVDGFVTFTQTTTRAAGEDYHPKQVMRIDGYENDMTMNWLSTPLRLANQFKNVLRDDHWPLMGLAWRGACVDLFSKSSSIHRWRMKSYTKMRLPYHPLFEVAKLIEFAPTDSYFDQMLENNDMAPFDSLSDEVLYNGLINAKNKSADHARLRKAIDKYLGNSNRAEEGKKLNIDILLEPKELTITRNGKGFRRQADYIFTRNGLLAEGLTLLLGGVTNIDDGGIVINGARKTDIVGNCGWLIIQNLVIYQK